MRLLIYEIYNCACQCVWFWLGSLNLDSELLNLSTLKLTPHEFEKENLNPDPHESEYLMEIHEYFLICNYKLDSTTTIIYQMQKIIQIQLNYHVQITKSTLKNVACNNYKLKAWNVTSIDGEQLVGEAK